jgi:hypothetical protein
MVILTVKKILCLSNPMGLGHVTRDLAVIQELRRRLPNVEAEWLTASPNTIFLKEAKGAITWRSRAELAFVIFLLLRNPCVHADSLHRMKVLNSLLVMSRSI